VLGTLSLAYAWKVQNYDLAVAQDTRITLQRSQLVINLWEAKRDQWVIAVNQELAKSRPDQLFLAAARAQANKATIMWQGYMKLRVEKDGAVREKIRRRNRLLSATDERLAMADTKSLLELSATDAASFKALKSLDALDKQFVDVVDETDATVRIANGAMSKFYVLGTALMLLSTIISSTQMTRVLSSLQRSV
jgi:cell division septum initiation protein DivIVA